MRCSKCGEENNNGKQICSVCGDDLSKQSYTPGKPKFSKLAIASFLFGILSIFLLFYIGALVSVLLGAISLYKINKSKKRLRGKRLAIAGMVISIILSSIAFFGNMDTAPIENDYTVNDLHPTNTEFDESYKILKSLSCTKENISETTGLTKSDIDVIEKVEKIIGKHNRSEIIETLKENTDSIKTAWKNGEKGRDVIKKLSNYPEINDLSKPDPEIEYKYHRSLRYLMQLYQVYTYLQTIEDTPENALAELTELNSVFRKLSISARSIITKLVCFAGLNSCIDAANFIANNTDSEQVLRNLAKEFTPLEKHHTSLYNPAVFEYLTWRKALKNLSLKPFFFFKPNSTLRLYRNMCNIEIKRVSPFSSPKTRKLNVYPSVYPDFLPSLKEDKSVSRFYQYYNIIGSLHVKLLKPAWDKIYGIKQRVEIKDRLFQFVLNKRLGNEAELPTDVKCHIDTENGKIYTSGKDKTPDTSDDVTLMINPELLNLD